MARWVREVLIVSTCNRVEILSATTPEQLDESAPNASLSFSNSTVKLPPGLLNNTSTSTG